MAGPMVSTFKVNGSPSKGNDSDMETYAPFPIGATLKGRICSPWEQFLSFKSSPNC